MSYKQNEVKAGRGAVSSFMTSVTPRPVCRRCPLSNKLDIEQTWRIAAHLAQLECRRRDEWDEDARPKVDRVDAENREVVGHPPQTKLRRQTFETAIIERYRRHRALLECSHFHAIELAFSSWCGVK
jgi:hypothetical protein